MEGGKEDGKEWREGRREGGGKLKNEVTSLGDKAREEQDLFQVQ